MRDLQALNVYSIDELGAARGTGVQTPEGFIEKQKKIEELKQAWSDLKRDKPEYKNDALVTRIMIRLESSVNFHMKACNAFSNMSQILSAQKSVEERKDATMKKLSDSKLERQAEIAAASAKMDVPPTPKAEPVAAGVPAKRKPGRPKRK